MALTAIDRNEQPVAAVTTTTTKSCDRTKRLTELSIRRSALAWKLDDLSPVEAGLPMISAFTGAVGTGRVEAMGTIRAKIR